MSKPRFDRLRERLLRAGVAPSHVRRYVRELRDHYSDLYHAHSAQGLPSSAADAAARAKLGSDDALAECVLGQPELRSIAARYPALFFGAAPVLSWLVIETAAALTLQSLGTSYFNELRAHLSLDRLVRLVELYCLALVRVLPVLMSAAVFGSAMQRRASARWPIVGATAMTMAAASIAVTVEDGQVGLMTSLLPGFRSRVLVGYTSFNPSALGESVARMSWMLALTLVPYALWLARRTRAHRQ